MSTSLSDYSEAIADAVAAVAAAVVQVKGRRRPASGLVYGADVVITNARALGREDHLQVKAHDGRTFDAELGGWDPSTGLAVLKVPGLGATPAVRSTAVPRVGQLVVAVGRSWSNAVSASAGIIAVIGGPLRTGRRQSVERVIRTTAPVHEGFAGGPLIDATGGVVAIATAAAIRGFQVAIPADIAWKTGADVLKTGRPSRGFLGIAGQAVQVPARQRGASEPETALLVVGITENSPADAAGVMVGDLLLRFDGQPVHSAEDLLDLLSADRIDREVPVSLIRGGNALEIRVTVGTRPAA